MKAKSSKSSNPVDSQQAASSSRHSISGENLQVKRGLEHTLRPWDIHRDWRQIHNVLAAGTGDIQHILAAFADVDVIEKDMATKLAPEGRQKICLQ